VVLADLEDGNDVLVLDTGGGAGFARLAVRSSCTRSSRTPPRGSSRFTSAASSTAI